ncbi:SDR family NAD(P)-dependent oxidoreductase [Salmonirosea aquatica]|uniref:SDR family oxidoreductase n=1 Tax=Salmonirosea aquatica TaxID=2654236 RepID=A0A7C9BEX9_9BACT|nr:SDR family oxidoreductase [Cytophagaceae bacterium SJW1-29]
MRLAGKVILVTGGCTGIGRAIAKRCAEEGAKLVVNGLEEEVGKELVRELGSEKATLLSADITRPEVPDQLVQRALGTFGRLDAVVNNAAYIDFSNIKTTNAALMHQMFAVNAIAPVAIIQAALPYLSEARGCVLNIGSVNAWCGDPNLLAYSMSKGALMTMTRNLGDVLFREYGVRVNQVNPGWVLTGKEKEIKRKQGAPEDWFTKVPPVFAPAGRLLAPEEIAAAAVYWLSDESGPVSGQVVDLAQYPFIGRNLPEKLPSPI